jgi:hypothetical protein
MRPPGIAGLETPHEDHVERGAGDDAQLPERRPRAREAPVGNPGAHATLDDDWKLSHAQRARPVHAACRRGFTRLARTNGWPSPVLCDFPRAVGFFPSWSRMALRRRRGGA